MGPVASAPELARPTRSRRSRPRSTPPATATSISSLVRAEHDDETAASEQVRLVLVAKPPPARPSWLPTAAAILGVGPGNVSAPATRTPVRSAGRPAPPG